MAREFSAHFDYSPRFSVYRGDNSGPHYSIHVPTALRPFEDGFFFNIRRRTCSVATCYRSYSSVLTIKSKCHPRTAYMVLFKITIPVTGTSYTKFE